MGGREAMMSRHMEIDATIDTTGHKGMQHRLALPGSLPVITHFFCKTKIKAKARAGILKPHRHPTVFDQLLEPTIEMLTDSIKPLIETRATILLKGSQCTKHSRQ